MLPPALDISEGKHVATSSAVEINASADMEKAKHRLSSAFQFDADLTDPNKGEHELTLEKTSPSESQGELLEDSPYAEVRASVPPTDDPTLPTNTIRVWVIGLSFATIGAGLNELFDLRSPSISISSIVSQLLSFWVGKGWARVMPNRERKLFGITYNLSPGPFNVKEHAVITIMSNVSFGTAYATNILVAQKHYYKQDLGWVYAILLVWSTQIVGYGLAGAARKFLVWPAKMIWPSSLVAVAMFHTLHKDHDSAVPGWSVTRFRWFMYVFAASFVWYFFPGYIAPFLSVFAVATWIKPNNVVINQLFGGFTGLSLIPITFDWTQIAGYVGSPLIPPWHAIANVAAGTVVMFLIVTPLLHYTNTWYAPYLPISDSTSYDNMQNVYNVTGIITPEFTLDVEKYKAYSPLFLSTTFALAYGMSFASIASVLTHTVLYHGRGLVETFRKSPTAADDDIHMRLMRRYPEVPNWWYYATFATTVAMSLAVTQAYETHLPWWAFFLAISISAFFFLPLGIIAATTNVGIGLNVIAEFVIGYLKPGRPVAMMIFKTYGYITMTQGQSFVSDLKIGHYMKIPPRTLFWTQVAATVWASLVQVAVLNWTLGTVKDVCTKHAADGFSCPGGRVFYTASVIWGLLGPARIFSSGQVYSGLLWFFLIGLISPIPFWYMARKRPNSWYKYVNAPVFWAGPGNIPPATPLNYLTSCFVGWVFQYKIKRRNPQWWSKYNYVTSAALDSGLAISTIFIFFVFSFSNLNGGSFPSWWGVSIAQSTMDAQGTAIRKTLEAGEKFGPKSW